MAVIELVREPIAKKATVKEAEAATKRAAKDAKKAEKPAKEEEIVEVEVEKTDEAAAVEVPEGAVAANEDGSSPDEAYTIKGNLNSMKYHEPDGQWFEQTVAEVWFQTAEAAEPWLHQGRRLTPADG